MGEVQNVSSGNECETEWVSVRTGWKLVTSRKKIIKFMSCIVSSTFVTKQTALSPQANYTD
jgi:hypothetical protein